MQGKLGDISSRRKSIEMCHINFRKFVDNNKEIIADMIEHDKDKAKVYLPSIANCIAELSFYQHDLSMKKEKK